MATTAGIVCNKKGFGCTVVDGTTVCDHEIELPANIADRGEQLCWLATESERLLNSLDCIAICIQQAAGGGVYSASPERNEVEAAIQIGAYRAGVMTTRLTREGVRAALGVPRGKGAYKSLLSREDVKVRSNVTRRDQYLLAIASR